MKAKKATAGERIAVATWKEIGAKGWNSRPDLQSRIDRLVARERRKERENTILAVSILLAARSMTESKESRPDGAVALRLAASDLAKQVGKRTPKPAKNGGKR